MKNNYKLIFGLAAFLLLCGLVWWSKKPVPLLTIPIQTPGIPNSTPASAATAKPTQPTPVAASPPQPSTAPGGNAAPQRKFANMPAHECRAILEEIRKQDYDSIMQAWLDAGRVDNDPTKQESITSMWGYTMRRRKASPKFYEKMKAIMADPSYSINERGDMIGVLTSAATPEAAELLIYEATTQADKEMKRMATVAISGLGENSDNEAISALLEPLWKGSNDPLMLRSVAESIGRIGAASSVGLLLNAVLTPGEGGKEKQEMAGYGLLKVHTVNAVPPLAAVLEKNPVGSLANKVAFRTLMQIGGKEAQQAMIHWLQTTDSSAAPLAAEWAADAGHRFDLEMAQPALNAAVPFRSEENRKAIRAALEANGAKEMKNKGK
jgi:hypothetical protein